MYTIHPTCRLHEMGSWHPESPQRLDAISDQLLANCLMPYLNDQYARQASDDDILRVHTSEYLARLREHVPKQGYYPVDPDTLMNLQPATCIRSTRRCMRRARVWRGWTPS